jgi:hypothetical protein
MAAMGILTPLELAALSNLDRFRANRGLDFARLSMNDAPSKEADSVRYTRTVRRRQRATFTFLETSSC